MTEKNLRVKVSTSKEMTEGVIVSIKSFAIAIKLAKGISGRRYKKVVVNKGGNETVCYGNVTKGTLCNIYIYILNHILI
jgi:hypothetical protein